MNNVQLNVSSLNRFITTGLYIEPELVGCYHEFNFDNNLVRISLPSQDKIPTERLTGDLLQYNTTRKINGIRVPDHYSVSAVDVTVKIPDQIPIPEKKPNILLINSDDWSESQERHMNHLCTTYYSTAKKAFGLWIRVMRWKSNNSAIGRPEIMGYESGWGTYLLANDTREHIWGKNDGYVIYREPTVTADQWESARNALEGCINPPLHIDLLFDGIEHQKVGDLRRAIIDLAVACEIYLRTLVSRSLPSGIKPGVFEHIDGANIRRVLTKFMPEILDEGGNRLLKKIASTLHSLFDLRNEILHTGKQIGITQDDCQNYIETIRKLFLIETPPNANFPRSEE